MNVHDQIAIMIMMSDTTVAIDPTESFVTTDDSLLIETCGLLLPWLVTSSESSLKERLERNHGFPVSWYDAKEMIDDNGVFTYPEDPPLAPIVRVILGNQVVYIYQYGMVSYLSGETVIYGRMD